MRKVKTNLIHGKSGSGSVDDGFAATIFNVFMTVVKFC